VTPVFSVPSPKSQSYLTMVRPVPGVDEDALNLTNCRASGESGENVNRATVGSGIVEVVVVDVLVLVVVSVIVTIPGPNAGSPAQPDTSMARRGMIGSSLRITTRLNLNQ
jgi:hypothetical protein